MPLFPPTLLLALLLPLPHARAARLVTEVPVLNSGVGGAGSAGAAVNAPAAASLNLPQPILSGVGLPSAHIPHPSATAAPAAAPAALAAAPDAAPGVLPKTLSSPIPASLPGGPEQTAGSVLQGPQELSRQAGEARPGTENPRTDIHAAYSEGRAIFDMGARRFAAPAVPAHTAGNPLARPSGLLQPPQERPGEADALLVGRVEHDGSAYTSGYTFRGKPLLYFNGSGSKLLFRHPVYRDYLLTLFPKKSPLDVTRMDKARRDAQIMEAAAVSRSNRKYEMDGRKLLAPHKLTPASPLKAGRMLLRDAKGTEWNTAYIVQERVYGDTAEDADVEDLPLVRALFNRLRELRVEVPDDANFLRNVMVGWTASDPKVRAYVIDAEGTKYLGPQSLIDRWLGRPDPLAKHYDALYAKVRRAVTSRPARPWLLASRAASPHPIKTAEDAAFRKGKADESVWWRRADFASARGPVMTLGEALSKVPAQDMPKLKARLARIRPGLGEDGAYRKALAAGAAAAAPQWRNPYLYFLTQAAAFQKKVAEGYRTGLALEDLLIVNKVTRDKIQMPQEEKYEAPAFAMGVLYNLLFDYAGEPRDPVKTDVLMDYVLGL